MYFRDADFDRFYDKAFKDSVPIVAEDAEAQIRCLNDICARMEQSGDFSISPFSGKKVQHYAKTEIEGCSTRMSFTVNLSIKEYADTTFSLEFKGNTLYLSKSYGRKFPVQDYSQLLIFKNEMELTAAKEWAIEKAKRDKQAKQEKLKQLKHNAIIGSIKAAAQEHGFEFMIEDGNARIVLYIRLAKWDYIQIFIPYKSFQEVLPHISETYLYIRKLRDIGVKIKTGASTKIKESDWKKVSKEA
ncbi:MAG: hypothetical protein IPO35_17810 [Uliginosibacterium sp.]|nr:hypothetical protein [Uliginosibacterium sp.]